MSTIITYEVRQVGEKFRVTGTIGDQVMNVEDDTEADAVLGFKDTATELLPNENALIFVTKEQKAAMEGYSEMEKQGTPQ